MSNICTPKPGTVALPLWACIRDKLIGGLALVLFIVALYGAVKTTMVWRRTRFYALNALFLWLATLQIFPDFLGRLFIDDDRTDFFSLFMRMIEMNTACLAYAHFALDSRGEINKFKTKVIPVAIVFLIIQLVLFIIALADDDGKIECAKPIWLLGSVSNLMLACVFSFYGGLALNEVVKIAGFTAPYSDSSPSFVQPGVLMKRRELWACVLVFLCSCACQVALDVWSIVVSTQTGGSLQSCMEREGDEWWLATIYILLECVAILTPPFVLVMIFFIEIRWHFTATDVILEPDEQASMAGGVTSLEGTERLMPVDNHAIITEV